MFDRAGRVNSPPARLAKVGQLRHESALANRSTGKSKLSSLAGPGLPERPPGPLAGGNLCGVGARVRVGLLGLDRAGQFHAERLSLRPEFEIVAGCEPTG